MRRLNYLPVLSCFCMGMVSMLQTACSEKEDDEFFKSFSAFFPTGTVWKETFVELGMPYNPENTVTYEIGRDTVVNGTSYKRVLKENIQEPYFIREEDNCVWLLSEDYTREIKLYDFNWDDNKSLFTEYLLKKEDGIEVRKEHIQTDESKSVTINGQSYRYTKTDEWVTIYNLGRITSLNRNSCLLGYKVTSPILPGLIFKKVLYIERNGKRVFQSESPEEWIADM